MKKKQHILEQEEKKQQQLVTPNPDTQGQKHFPSDRLLVSLGPQANVGFIPK